MLDGSDTQTFYSLRNLYEKIKDDEKPLLFWVGAGASKWCDFPLWDELAEKIHSNFLKTGETYKNKNPLDLIEGKKFPEYFQLCEETDGAKYRSLLGNFLRPRAVTPVYERFLETIGSIDPLFIVTTNADETLEKRLPNSDTVQRSDIERCSQLLQTRHSFICKLHGSVSSIESLVFTKTDYDRLIQDENYLRFLEDIFDKTHVVFIGYSLSDRYIIELLSRNNDARKLFGTGPHFVVIPSRTEVPDFVEPIRYEPSPHKDHRSAIQVLDEISTLKKSSVSGAISNISPSKVGNLRSSHLIAEIIPFGSYSTSEIYEINGGEQTILMGNGLTNSEMPKHESTTLHDLIVGLVCFDTLYTSLNSLNAIHKLVGGEIFAELVLSGCLKLIYWERLQCLWFEGRGKSEKGEMFSVNARGSAREHIDRIIRDQINPYPGREKDAEKVFERIHENTDIISHDIEPNISGITKGILLRQSIRELIGMSGGMSLSSVPPWMHFPVLRLTDVVKIGAACHLLGIASTKLEYGATKLAGPAFAASLGNLWADETASYVLTGRLNADLNSLLVRNPNVFKVILKFRDTNAGTELRKEVFENLCLKHGSDFVTSVNAGLSQIIPFKTLQKARDQLVGLLMPGIGMLIENSTVVWNNYEYSNIALQLWKKRSREILNEYCSKMAISSNSRCPCGSGERLKFCCEESLSD